MEYIAALLLIAISLPGAGTPRGNSVGGPVPILNTLT
jgi:hypothetical protein